MNAEYQPHVTTRWVEPSDWESLANDIQKLEYQAKIEFHKLDKIASSLEDVRRHISAVAMFGNSHLLAVGFPSVDERVDTSNPRIIDSSNATVRDVRLRQVDGEDRVVIDCELVDPGDERVMMPFAVLPLGIIRAESPHSVNNPIAQFIASAQIFAANVLTQPSFYQLPAQQQHDELYRRVAREILADIQTDYHEDVVVAISSREVFVRNPRDWDILHQADPRAQPSVVRGRIVDVRHYESVGQHPPYIADRSNVRFDGLPCLVISNDNDSSQSYIPLKSITNFSSSIDDQL
ncbi:MAG: hypothetical protein ABIR91_04670 [Candidatus Saccharimonadales bacterium]